MDAALASEIMQELRVQVAQPFFRDVLAHSPKSYGVSGFRYDFEHILLGSPYELLGMGHFSAVVKHTAHPGFAFKIGFRAEDSGAMYAAWCRDNELPHTPRIIHMDRWPEAYMVCMPCYIPSHMAPTNEDDVSALDSALCNYLTQEGRASWASTEAYSKYLDTPLHETCVAIREFFKGVARIDMHYGNWMWDADGNVIITDPVSFNKVKTPAVSIEAAACQVPSKPLSMRWRYAFQLPQLTIGRMHLVQDPMALPCGAFIKNVGTRH